MPPFSSWSILTLGICGYYNFNVLPGRLLHPISCPMLITRKVEFSASHVCRNPPLSDAENRALFGAAANPHGHGHNYVLEVTLEGEPDPVTGMVLDLKELKDDSEPRSGRALRSPLSESRSAALRPRGPDTGEHRDRYLEPLAARICNGPRGRLHQRARLRDRRPVRGLFRRVGMIRVTRRYRFSASHRLHTPQLSDGGESRTVRQVQQSVRPRPQLRGRGERARAAWIERSGRAVDHRRCSTGLVRRAGAGAVRSPQPERRRSPRFAAVVPTTENLAREIVRRLKQNWHAAFPGRVAASAKRSASPRRSATSLKCRHHEIE